MIAGESSSTLELKTIAMYTLSSNLTAVLGVSYLCFIGNKSEAQRDDVTCLKSHSELPYSLNRTLKTPNSELALVLFLF